ncbi:NUDIX hydrolase [Kribbella sp. HUAS MG21]|uniref:NUDIX hydrolase n=1 Tax=Kribbella sp. HUAS MG21 TaxID=3160966 RepID=A0AAU7THJ3_9ACTN
MLRQADGRFLVVRHSYADTRRWALPGGGYNPTRETPAQAVAREIQEELGLAIPADAFTVVTTTLTTLEGKHDTLTILTAYTDGDELKFSAEIAEARWVRSLQELGDAPLSKWLLLALAE